MTLCLKRRSKTLDFPLCLGFAVAEESRLQIYLHRKKTGVWVGAWDLGAFLHKEYLGRATQAHAIMDQPRKQNPTLLSSL